MKARDRASWARWRDRHAAERDEALDAGCACTWEGALRVQGTSAGCPLHDPRLDPRFATVAREGVDEKW